MGQTKEENDDVSAEIAVRKLQVARSNLLTEFVHQVCPGNSTFTSSLHAALSERNGSAGTSGCNVTVGSNDTEVASPGDQAPLLSTAQPSSIALNGGPGIEDAQDSSRRPATPGQLCSELAGGQQLSTRDGCSRQDARQAPAWHLSGAEPGSDRGLGGCEAWGAWQVATELRLYLAAMSLTFLVTLAVFPGIASSVCSRHSTASAPPCTPHPAAGRFYGVPPLPSPSPPKSAAV